MAELTQAQADDLAHWAEGILEVLERAVAEALERKHRLGQYAVMWREGRVVTTLDVRRCVDALRAIIDASDRCQGHAGCEHSMKPWGDARIILCEFDGDAEALEEQRRLMATHPRYDESQGNDER